MKIKLIKAIRELQINWRRTFLAVFALALGIWGAGSVFVSNYILTNDLNENYQQTLPAHLILFSNDFEKFDLQTFRNRPEVALAEFRDFSMHRIEIRPDTWVPLLLYGVNDFEHFQLEKVFHEAGKRKPEKGSILLERDGMKISDIQIGSSPRLRMGNKIMEVPVSGICFDPAQAPATQEQIIFAYTDQLSYQQLTGLSNNNRLIIRLNNVSSAEDVQNTMAALVGDLEKKGIRITNHKIPLFNEHPHQWQLETLLFVIGSIGFLAFIMGAVLVSQLMQSVMAKQIRQIAIMKSIGATKGQIFQIYLAMLLLIGLAAGIIAVPLAVATGVKFSLFVTGILNFKIFTTVSAPIYLIMFLASLLLPVLLSLSILIKGANTNIKALLNNYGISVKNSKRIYFGSNFIKAKVSGIFSLALKNSVRNTRRLSMTILAMALGVAIFSTGFNVRKSLWNLLSDLSNEMQYDIQVVLSEQLSPETATFPFENMGNLKSIHTWNSGSGLSQSKLLSTNKGVGIVALPYNTALIKPKVIKGRWLQQSEDIEVVFNQQAWEKYAFPEIGSILNLAINDTIISVRMVGVVEQLNLGTLFIDAAKYDAIFNPHHLINTITFLAESKDYRNVSTLKKEIEKIIASSDLKVSSVMSHANKVRTIYAHLNIILSVILFLSFLVLVVSAVGMASATSINIGERTREIGVMRAIGATPKKIYSLFTYEGMIISVGSIVLGLVLAYPISEAAAVFFGRLMLGEQAVLEYAFSSLGFIITLAVTLFFGWFASRLPAVNAVTKVSTREALTYE